MSYLNADKLQYLLSLASAIFLFLPNESDTQFSVVKTDVSHLKKPNPSISRFLNQPCNMSDYENYNVMGWWNGFFSSKSTTPDPEQAKFNAYMHSTPAPTKADLNKLCFFTEEYNAYLYECSMSFEVCSCMKVPVRTVAVALDDSDTKSIACLVDVNETCISEQRDKLSGKRYQPYQCIPQHFCLNTTKKCTPCPNTFDQDLKQSCPKSRASYQRFNIPWNWNLVGIWFSTLLYSSI